MNRKIVIKMAKQYAVYAGLFLLFWLVATEVDLQIGPYDDLSISYLLHGSLAEALTVGLQMAFVGVAIVAVVLRITRRGPQHSNAWIVLGLLSTLSLFAVYLGMPNSVFGTGGYIGTDNYLVAVNEQLLYQGGSAWATFWRWFVLGGVLPLLIGFWASIWWAARRSTTRT